MESLFENKKAEETVIGLILNHETYRKLIPQIIEEDRRIGLVETLGTTEELTVVRKAIARNRWIFAKTYAAFCPHEYTLRKNWADDAEYRMLVKFIWTYGLEAYYGRKTHPNKYWFDHETGWYYFITPEDTDENGDATDAVILINRAKITEFDFWKDEGAGIIRCAPRRKHNDR